MKPIHKTILLWGIIILCSISILQLISFPPSSEQSISYSEFVKDIKENRIENVVVKGNVYTGKYKPSNSGKKFFKAIGPSNSDKINELLANSQARVEFLEHRESSMVYQLLIYWLPMIVLVGLIIFIMRQLQAGGGKAMSFGKSKARLMTDKSRRVTFADVAGVDEAKEELQEIIEFLKNPKKFTKLGGRLAKGVLLMGPPGTGKTLLARAIAGEAGAPFFSISGSDFVEMFVGVGASRVRDLFEQGKKHAPCIVFIDEIDAVGRHRGAGLGGGHDEREQTLNQLLVEMDGFESNEGVILVAATNRPDVLDPALLRPGRFDRRVVVAKPDLRGRELILRIHMRKVPMAADVNLSIIARGTPGFSGADLQNLVNEAALVAARTEKKAVEMVDLEFAKDKVLMGSERRSMLISEEERENTAYHEAGHTLVAKLILGTDPIHKVTIIPRGMALGLTQQLPEEDKHSYSKEYTENRIAILMGGRIAEELIFDSQTTGAGNDFQHATDLARKMVCEWGMSEKLGPIHYANRDEEIFLGRELAKNPNYSPSTSDLIDEEIKALVLRNYERAKKLLSEHIEQLHRLAKALLEMETLSGDQIDLIMSGGTPAIVTPSPEVAEVKTRKRSRSKPIISPQPTKA